MVKEGVWPGESARGQIKILRGPHLVQGPELPHPQFISRVMFA